ncbi:MAG: hypothetical protein KDD50_16790 [Bdellovibrionales bacterium]|nr:hypothetical protein [Bdellovibrionales bacterium]
MITSCQCPCCIKRKEPFVGVDFADGQDFISKTNWYSEDAYNKLKAENERLKEENAMLKDSLGYTRMADDRDNKILELRKLLNLALATMSFYTDDTILVGELASSKMGIKKYLPIDEHPAKKTIMDIQNELEGME